MRGAEGMMTLMNHLNKLGHTVIIITHDMKLVASMYTGWLLCRKAG